MSNISFTAHGRCARATYCEPITTGSVGLTVSFAFDAAWSGLQKTAIFRGSGMAVDLVLSGEAATVPPEVLTIPGGDLRVGVWGADPDGNVIIPTVWATVGEIVPGAAPSGFDPQPPAPSWAAQVQEIAREALDNSEAALETANDTAARMTALEDEISGDLERAGEYARQAQEAAANADRDAQTASAAAATAGAAAGSASTAAATATEKAAATARDAAAVQDAADDAGTAKEAAEEAAASVSASAAQIEQNRQDIADQKSAIESLDALVDRKAGMLVDTASGAIASFVPDATIDHLLGLEVAVEPVQAGSGDPSPDNVRPISGWDEVKVTRTGKNLFPDAGDVIAVGNKKIRYNNPIIFKGQTITLSVSDIAFGNGYTSAPVFFLAKDTRGIALVLLGTERQSGTWTATEDVYGLHFYATPALVTNPGVTTTYYNVQIELGSTATAFKPYTGDTYAITLGQTVYGGALDVTAGTLTVDRARFVLDGTESYSLSANAKRATTNALRTSGIKYNHSNNATIEGDISNMLPQTTPNLTYAGNLGFSVGNDGTIHISDGTGSMTTLGTQNWLAENPLVLVLKLAAPLTIQLDPVTIATIVGQTNNVWADTGDVSVEYAADLKAYIDSKIAALAAQIVNS